MGEPGGFTRDDLRFAFANTTLALVTLGWRTFATVLIGANTGLPIGRVSAALLDGIADALTRLPEGTHGPLNVRIFTRNPDKQATAAGAASPRWASRSYTPTCV